MTFKLHSLTRWSLLAPGAAIEVAEPSGDGDRRVRINVNVADQTTFYVETEDGPQLLGTIPPGQETFEFTAYGRVAVFAKEGSGEVYYQTSEQEPTHIVVVDPRIFTKIANRRHRNPELEEMMQKMQLNIDRRLERQAREFEAALARRQRELTHGLSNEVVKTNAPGATANNREGPVQFEKPPASAAKQGAGSGSESERSGGETEPAASGN